MLEVARFETERRMLASLAVTAGLAAFGAMAVFIAPAITEQVDFSGYVSRLPDSMVEGFGLEALGSVAGFVAIEVYQATWILAVGGFVAYSMAGAIAGAVESDTLEMTLAAPVSRTRVLVETYLALLVPLALVNVGVFGVVYVGSILIDEPLVLTDLAAVHVLSVPAMLCYGAFGLACSVFAPKRRLAEGLAVGGVFVSYVLALVTSGTDVAWLGALSPSRYYDPVSILTAAEYDLVGAGGLLAASAVLLVVAVAWFERRDLQ